MPATQLRPALTRSYRNTKTCSFRLRIRHLTASLVSDAIIPILQFLDEAAIDERVQPLRRVLPSDPDIFRDHAWRLDGQLLGIRQRREDAIISLRHPLGEIPDVHGYAAVRLQQGLNSAYHYIFVILLYGFVKKYKTDATHECSNDWRACADVKMRPGRGGRPEPAGRLTTMSEHDRTGLKSRHAQDASTPISFDASQTIRGAYDDLRLEVAR